MARLFPIADLRTLAARALQDGGYTPAASGRVRAVPDTRTIRYYTTLGLIDRPAEMKGRTALYSNRHVLQIVAIKRLQSQDMTLSDIQQSLLGADNRKLRKIASLPSGFWDSADDFLRNRKRQSSEQRKEKKAKAPGVERRRDFWAASPDESVPTNAPIASNSELESSSLVSQQINIPIRPGVSINIEQPRHKDSLASNQELFANEIQLAAIQVAAEDLIAELVRQELLNTDP